MNRPQASWFPAVALVAALAGCAALTREPPVKQAFLLEPAAPPALASPLPVSARVGTVTVSAAFRDRSFVVRESELRFETDFYHEFAVVPAAMIGEAMARAFDRANLFTRMIPPGTAPEADLVIDAFVTSLYADRRDPQKPAAELALTLFVSRADRPGAPLWSREYRRRVPLTAQSAEGYAGAQTRALSEILAEATRDLAAAADALR
jgi:ABC-type uncharacterized transport system auxiliary subunit